MFLLKGSDAFYKNKKFSENGTTHFGVPEVPLNVIKVENWCALFVRETERDELEFVCEFVKFKNIILTV